jgi:hypothetical protein
MKLNTRSRNYKKMKKTRKKRVFAELSHHPNKEELKFNPFNCNRKESDFEEIDKIGRK